MNGKYMFIVAASMTLMLIGVTELTTSNSASAQQFNLIDINKPSGNFLQIPLTPLLPNGDILYRYNSFAVCDEVMLIHDITCIDDPIAAGEELGNAISNTMYPIRSPPLVPVRLIPSGDILHRYNIAAGDEWINDPSINWNCASNCFDPQPTPAILYPQ
jgi:hypothetical protein